MAQPAAVLSILVKANTGPATTGLLRLNSQIGATEKGSQRAAKAVSGLVKNLAFVGAAGTVAGIGYAVKKAADFEAQLSSLGAVSNATGKQMDKLRKQALKAGADTKFSALEAAEAQTELAKGGLKVAQIMRGGLKSSLALAAAGEMELADAAEATVNAMKLFGLRGRDAMKIADGFATAANRTTSDVADFAMALKMGGSAAKAAGLSFTETTAALEALAEMGIRNSDAGTSLKTMLVQIAAPTAKQAEATKKLGLRFFDAEGNMKSLTKVSGMLRAKLGDLTNEQRLAAVKTIAGTDGMRALLALYDAGPGKIAKFQRELEKEGTAAEVARKKQDNLKGSLEQLGGSIETLGIQIGTGMIPMFRGAADELTRFANDVGKIVDRKDLSVGEKLQKSLDLAEVRAKPWVDKLVVAIEKAEIPERLGRLISGAVPVIAEAAAKAAPVVVGAFIKGFLAADTWGRLAVGAWLLARMGGPPAFMKVGAKGGAAMGAGMAGGVAASGLKGKLSGLLRSWGPSLGVVLGLAVVPDLVKKIKEGGFTGKIQSGAETTGGAAKRAQEIVDAEAKTRGGLLKTRQELARYEADIRRVANAPGKPQSWIDYYSRIADSIRKVGEPIRNKIKDFQAVDARVKQMGDNVARSLRGMEKGGSKSFRDMAHQVGVSTRNMLRVGGKNSAETRQQIHRQFRIAANKVQQAMDDKVISVKTGTARLHELAKKELGLYGISAGRVNVVLAKGANGEDRPFQRGAYISEGRSVGDSVPALLERGEYVLNRRAVKKVGRQSLDRLNYSQAPRFQGGGIVELLHPGNEPKGHSDHLHVAMSTVAGIVALGRKLQKLGWLVGEHPAFGGIQGSHSATGYHYTGQAIDVNWPDAGQEAAKIRALLPLLGGDLGGLGRVFKGLPRVALEGPASVALEAGQGALDRIRSAANASIARAVSVSEGAEASLTGGKFDKQGLAALWRQANPGLGNASLMAAIALAESSGNPRANGPPDGRGLWQIEWPIWSKSLGSLGDPYDAFANAKMAGAILQRQGLGAWVVYNTGAYRKFMEKGGPVGMQSGGNPWASPFDPRNTAWGKQLGQKAAPPTVLGKLFTKTLKKIRGGGSAKVRQSAIDKMMSRIKGVGLPDRIEKNLGVFSKDSAVFGEMADRAATLTTEDAAGNSIGGVVNGKTEIQWLEQQLAALFKWRNAMARAQEILVERREMVSRLLERARERMRIINAQLRKLGHKPKKNKAAIRVLTHEKGALTKIIGDASTGLVGKRSALGTARTTMLENLDTVQGIGSPMGVLKSLPTVGVLGGNILQVQTTLRDLNVPRAPITDADAGGGDSEQATLLQELLREANLRTAVSEAQFKVFKTMPQFATGGIVPGVTGAPTPAVVHGGEGVFTQDQMAAIGGGQQITVVVQDGAVDPNKIRVIAGNETRSIIRREARVGSRGLPGRGGGLSG